MWKIKKKYTLGKNFLEKFIEYKNTKLTGKPRGLIKPKIIEYNFFKAF